MGAERPRTLRKITGTAGRPGAYDVDGFNIAPHLLPASLVDIVDKLVPESQERGVYRTEHKGSTLREHLELLPVDLSPVDQDPSA